MGEGIVWEAAGAGAFLIMVAASCRGSPGRRAWGLQEAVVTLLGAWIAAEQMGMWIVVGNYENGPWTW